MKKRQRYLVPAHGPLDGALISFRKRNEASRRLFRTMPLTVFIMFGRMKFLDSLLVIEARYEICHSTAVT
jgi:hypothetical protein